MTDQSKTICKAVIPAAGLGKRLFPITKVLPKEMYPIGNYPAIEWVVAEAIASGCKEVAVIIGPQKSMIEDYLTAYCPALSRSCQMSFIIQPEPLGFAHALILAKDFAAGQPVAVLLPDDLCAYERPPILQMRDIFEGYVSAVFSMVEDRVSGRWGRDSWHLRKVKKNEYLLEKYRTKINTASEKLFLVGIGRYILPPLFITYSEKALNAKFEGELDDGTIFDEMITNGEPILGCRINARRFDISTVDGYLAAWRYFGNRNPLDVYLRTRKK